MKRKVENNEVNREDEKKMGVDGVLNENATFWFLSYPTFFFIFLLFNFIKFSAIALAHVKSRKI